MTLHLFQAEPLLLQHISCRGRRHFSVYITVIFHSLRMATTVKKHCNFSFVFIIVERLNLSVLKRCSLLESDVRQVPFESFIATFSFIGLFKYQTLDYNRFYDFLEIVGRKLAFHRYSDRKSDIVIFTQQFAYVLNIGVIFYRKHYFRAPCCRLNLKISFSYKLRSLD